MTYCYITGSAKNRQLNSDKNIRNIRPPENIVNVRSMKGFAKV